MDDTFKKGDYNTLSQSFKLCNPISDPAGYRHLLLWLRNAFTIMVTVQIRLLLYYKEIEIKFCLIKVQ